MKKFGYDLVMDKDGDINVKKKDVMSCLTGDTAASILFKGDWGDFREARLWLRVSQFYLPKEFMQ